MENRRRHSDTLVDTLLALGLLLLAAACRGEPTSSDDVAAPAPPATAAKAASAPSAAPAAAKPAAAPAASAAAAPRQEPIAGPPAATLLVAQAQFVDQTTPDGRKTPVPGPAKLTIVRRTADGWTTTVLEDPDSNVLHKAMAYEGGILTIGGNQAMLKTWTFADGKWSQQTRWNPKFGGKFDRLRDIERGDLDHDGTDELVIATHDQGVIAIVHPEEGWRVEEIDRQANMFVHEIEIGDVDGDGKMEFFATPSKPNKLDQEQPGEVTMYKSSPRGWQKSIVDAPGDTHAKEILVADVDRDGVSELYIVWEGALGPGGSLLRPVTVKQYRMQKDGTWASGEVASVPDRQMRAIAAGDVTGDGKIDLVAGGLSSGLWLFEQDAAGWKKTLIDGKSSGFEHPVLLADLDGDGMLEIYVAAEDQAELRQYRFVAGRFESTKVAPLQKGDITWNVNDAKL
jgi:hypothetical protein